MLRRSSSVLLAFFLLGLLMILGQAFFNKEGVKDSIEKARLLLGNHEPSAAVKILNRTQRSLGPTSALDLHRDLHLLRSAALADTDLRNYDRAVQDLDFLLAELEQKDFNPEDARGFPFAADRVEVRRRRIKYLLLSGDAKFAIKTARAFLADHEGDQIVLDLAGRALQALYQKKRNSILDKDLDLVFSVRQRRKLEQALTPWLYREADAPTSSRDYKDLVEILNEVLDPLRADEILEQCLDLRSDIQACASYYSQALRGPLVMPASLQGYTGIRLRAGDLDGAAALSWLYLLRSDGPVAALAARRGMEAHLLQGDPAMALRVGKTWMTENEPTNLDPEKVETPIDQDWNVARAYAYYSLVLFRLNKSDELLSFAQSLTTLLGTSGHELQMSYHWSQGLAYSMSGTWGECEAYLAVFCSDTAAFFPPDFGLDLFLIAMRTRVDAAMANKNPTLAQKVLKEWIFRRPESIEPRLALAKLMVDDLKLYRMASKECELILDMPRAGDSHDRALNLMLVAQDGFLSGKGRDSLSLFQGLIQKKRRIHLDLPHKVLRLGIAIQASLLGADQIFEANIRRFLEDYPSSNLGRFLLAQHYYETERFERSLYETNSILESNPDYPAAALLHRKALLATEAPLRTRLAFDREFMDHFSDRPEAAEIMGGLLLARGATQDALFASSESLGARASPNGLPWIRGRARIAQKDYLLALSDLLDVPTDSPHREETLLLALQTALDHDLPESVPGIVQKLLDEDIPAETLSVAAHLCGKKGLQDAVLELLDPIYNGADKASIRARNGTFFTLRARAFLAKGRTQAARDMLRRAVSFDDGSEAGVYLVLTELFSGKKEEAAEILAQLGALEGPALTLLFLDAKLGDFASARKRLRAARLPGLYLEKILLLALDSEEGIQQRTKEVDPKKSTGVKRLDSFARGHAMRVLEALCFAPDMAFRVRSDEAQASLQEWISDGEDAVIEDFLVKLISAWRTELQGSRIAAREGFGALLNPSSQDKVLQDFMILTHREFLRLAAKDYDFLTNTVLTGYFVGLVHQLGSQNLVELGITQLALLGQGRVFANANQLDKTLEVFEVAKLLANKDLPILEMLAKAQEHTGRPDLAIETRLQRYSLQTGMQRVQEMQALLLLRDGIARAGKLQEPGYQKTLAKLQDAILDYLETKASPTHPPLGRATLIAIRDLWDKKPETVAELLTRCFTPYTTGQIAPGMDPDGLEALLSYLLEKGHTQAWAWLKGVLLQDPSLVSLRLLEAREMAKRGEVTEAIDALVHLQNLLPSQQTILALARLRGRTGIGSALQTQDLLTRLEKDHPKASTVEQGLLRFRLGDPVGCLELLAKHGEMDLDPIDLVLIDLARLYARETGDFVEIRNRMEGEAAEHLEVAPDLAAQLQYMVTQEAKAGR